MAEADFDVDDDDVVYVSLASSSTSTSSSSSVSSTTNAIVFKTDLPRVQPRRTSLSPDLQKRRRKQQQEQQQQQQRQRQPVEDNERRSRSTSSEKRSSITAKKKSIDAEMSPSDIGKRSSRPDATDAGVQRDSKRKSGAGKVAPSSSSSSMTRNGDGVKRTSLDGWQTTKKKDSSRR